MHGLQKYYYPDAAVLDKSGRLVIVEVKPVFMMYRVETLTKEGPCGTKSFRRARNRLPKNAGRRPLSILSLTMKAGSAEWSRYLKQPGIEMVNVRSSLELIRELEHAHLAQDIAVKLAEDESFELRFSPEDRDDFIGTHWDPPPIAEELLVRDVAGKRYPVKGSREHVEQLLSAAKWKSAAISPDIPK